MPTPKKASPEEEEQGFVEDEEEEVVSVRRKKNPPKRSISLGVPEGLGKYLVMVVLAFMVSMAVVNFNGVTKEVFDTNLTNIAETIETIKADVVSAKDVASKAGAGVSEKITADVAGATKGLADRVGAVEQQANTAVDKADSANTRVGTAESNISDLKSDYSAVTAELASIKDSLKAVELKASGLTTRIEALEETPSEPSGGGGGETIPNVDITAKVTDEGILNTSDNSTTGTIKLTLTNNGTKDIEDIVLYVYIFLDDCYLTNQTISASYGSWSVRERQREEIQIKGRISRLSEGENRRIYIDVTSFANDYWFGRTTYLDTSSNDVEVVDWNYE
jgi:hypothetical protein